jgi:methylglyoxal synthase
MVTDGGAVKARKNIALVAHDNRRRDLIEWVEWNVHILAKHTLTCTGTTGTRVEKSIRAKMSKTGLPADFVINKLRSGPLGGDQQLGALITEGKIDFGHLLLGSDGTPSA